MRLQNRNQEESLTKKLLERCQKNVEKMTPREIYKVMMPIQGFEFFDFSMKAQKFKILLKLFKSFLLIFSTKTLSCSIKKVIES